MQTKNCTTCNQSFDLSHYPKKRGGKYGVASVCRSCRRLYSIKYREANKGQINEKFRMWANSPDQGRKRSEYRTKTRERNNEYAKDYRSKPENKIRAREYNKKYLKERKQRDPNFRLAHALRKRLNSALKRNYKAGSAVQDLGCSISELKLYLESKFQSGMTWENYGYHGWHIDHIIPLSAFNLSDREQFQKAVHFTNLQPLWAEDNLKKSDHV